MLNKLTANRFILTALQEDLAVYAVPLWLLVTFVMWWARTAFGWRHHLFMSKFKRHKIILRPVAVNYNAHCKNLQLFWHLSQKITILTSLAYLIRATEADGWVHGFKVSFSQQSVKVFMFFLQWTLEIAVSWNICQNTWRFWNFLSFYGCTDCK